MTKNIKELLPLGSIVRLQGAKKPLMIFGQCQTDANTNQDYDYIGVLWPMGSMGNQTNVLFNHSGIEEVLFTGFDNEVRQGFLGKLQEFYDSKQ